MGGESSAAAAGEEEKEMEKEKGLMKNNLDLDFESLFFTVTFIIFFRLYSVFPDYTFLIFSEYEVVSIARVKGQTIFNQVPV